MIRAHGLDIFDVVRGVLSIVPYFENESNQGQGPRAEIPKPLARVPDSRIATTFVKGEIRRAEEGLYIVRDSTGKDVPIYIGKDTDIQGALRVGEKVEAQVAKDGLALSIRVTPE